MKLLFDQNISYRITRLLDTVFPNCLHVSGVGLNGKSDMDIWNYTKENNLVIVSFDADFFDLAVLKGIPPKVIWLRMGNTTTLSISHYLVKNKDVIYNFCKKENENVCLEIS
jgi:predicted nuclease of predicted toxin-antitoxin system